MHAENEGHRTMLGELSGSSAHLLPGTLPGRPTQVKRQNMMWKRCEKNTRKMRWSGRMMLKCW